MDLDRDALRRAVQTRALTTRRRPLPNPIASLALALLVSACTGEPNPLPESGAQLFEGPVVTPLALDADGETLVRVNPLHNSITVFDLTETNEPFDVPVGLEPVSAAFRPKASPSDPDLVFVVNHISDSISVVDLAVANVVQTIQELDADGVTRTNEPTGIAFASPSRAFVTLDQPNEVIVLDRNSSGVWAVSPIRLRITAQGPRALTVSGGRLYVAAFESGNQTMPASCGPGADPGYDCFVVTLFTPGGGVRLPIEVDDGAEAAPDRDLFVFEIAQLDASEPPLDADGFLPPIQVVEHVGTLMYGAASTASQRIFLTQTDALNAMNGSVLTNNRMFENELVVIDCDEECGAPDTIDLDALGGGVAPTPYGVAVSGDGEVVVVTAAGADTTAVEPATPGLFVLDENGALLSTIDVGDIPQGVAVHSNPSTGVADTAYVWNSIDGTVSIVDLTDPSDPSVSATLDGPESFLPTALREGRRMFKSARASSSHQFSCESCHPNGHTDQLLWVLNTEGIPVLGAGAWDPTPETPMPESRVTLSVRGLRDTLPLHWDGRLGKPAGPPSGQPLRPIPQSCNAQGFSLPELIDVDCFLDLIDASLAGVMCSLADCPTGAPGRPGELNGTERQRLASYLTAVAPQPGTQRRPSGDLSPAALEGIASLIDDPNSTAGGCAAPGRGCHEFPHGTSADVPNFLAAQPGPWRTLWDRFPQSSNGAISSNSVLLSMGELVRYDSAMGPSERASYGSFVVTNFLIGQETADWQFQFLLEMSAGYSGLLGRQLTLSPAMVSTTSGMNDALARVQAYENAAREGRITARGRLNLLGAPLDGAYDPADERWELDEETEQYYDTAALLNYLRTSPASTRVTFVADLPQNLQHATSGFATAELRQPLIRYRPPVPPADSSPEEQARFNAERLGRAFLTVDPETPDLDTPEDGVWWSPEIASLYVTEPTTTRILVDGVACGDCEVGVEAAYDVTWRNTLIWMPESFVASLAVGLHTLQIQTAGGYFSNEIPFKVE